MHEVGEGGTSAGRDRVPAIRFFQEPRTLPGRRPKPRRCTKHRFHGARGRAPSGQGLCNL